MNLHMHGYMRSLGKSLALSGGNVYKKPKSEQLNFDEFELSFGGCLDKNNRWVTLARIITLPLSLNTITLSPSLIPLSLASLVLIDIA